MGSYEKKNLNIFLITQIISSFTYAFSSTIFNYQALALTGSSLNLALSIIMNNIPKIFLLHLAGSLADKLNKKKLFILVDIFYFLSFISILVLITIFKSSSAEKIIVIIGSFVLGLFKAFSIPITKSIIPVLASREKILKVNSYEISNDKIARTLGPIISIVMLSSVGFSYAILISSILYLITGLTKTFLSVEEPLKLKSSFKSNMLKETYTSVLSLFKDKNVFLLVLSAVITQLFFHPFNYIVLPSLLSKLRDDSNLNIMKFLLSIVDFLKLSKRNLWLNFIAFINLGGALGTLLSMLYLNLFKNKLSYRKELTLAVAGKVIFGILTVMLVAYSGYFGNNLNLSTLVILLFFMNLGLYFSFNLFTIYFANYYQKRINKESLGKFIANFMVLFNLSSSLGSLIYGFSSENNLYVPLIILSLGIILKTIVHMAFLSVEKDYNS